MIELFFYQKKSKLLKVGLSVFMGVCSRKKLNFRLLNCGIYDSLFNNNGNLETISLKIIVNMWSKPDHLLIFFMYNRLEDSPNSYLVHDSLSITPYFLIFIRQGSANTAFLSLELTSPYFPNYRTIAIILTIYAIQKRIIIIIT